jgi:hypothetical protein
VPTLDIRFIVSNTLKKIVNDDLALVDMSIRDHEMKDLSGEVRISSGKLFLNRVKLGISGLDGAF